MARGSTGSRGRSAASVRRRVDRWRRGLLRRSGVSRPRMRRVDSCSSTWPMASSRLATAGQSAAGQDRVVYLDADAVVDLKAWRKAQAKERLTWGEEYHDGGYVFTSEDGTPYHPDYLSKVVSRLLRRAGIPAGKLHALRHFRAAWLISIGTDIAVVSKTLGHKSIAITSDIYGSLHEKAAKDLVEKARGYVSRRRSA